MYGQFEMNNHFILRFGLTKEFFDLFKDLEYLGIPIAPSLIRHFHIYIRKFVENNMENLAQVNELQKKHRLYTKADAQKALTVSISKKEDLFRTSARRPKTVIMPATFYSLAIDQFKQERVILLVHNRKGADVIAGKKLPKNILVFHLNRGTDRVKISKTIKSEIKAKITKLINKMPSHPIFKQPKFAVWMNRQCLVAMRMIHVLNMLVKHNPNTVVIYPYTITFPGSVLNLIAEKYNIPFILNPVVLVSDRTLIPIKATYICVWGKYYESWLRKRGISPRQIRVTGNFKFENVHQQVTVTKSQFLRKFHLPPSHLIITYTTQPFFDNKVTMQWIKFAVQKLPLTVIIKPHPYDQTDYSVFCEKNIKIAQPDLNIYDYMANTDYVMAISSTTAIEAALFNNGIIILQPNIPFDYEHNSHDFNDHLVKANAGSAVYNKRQLKKLFKKIVSNPTFRESTIKQSQRFLNNTLQMTESPSLRIRKLVTELWARSNQTP